MICVNQPEMGSVFAQTCYREVTVIVARSGSIPSPAMLEFPLYAVVAAWGHDRKERGRQGEERRDGCERREGGVVISEWTLARRRQHTVSSSSLASCVSVRFRNRLHVMLFSCCDRFDNGFA